MTNKIKSQYLVFISFLFFPILIGIFLLVFVDNKGNKLENTQANNFSLSANEKENNVYFEANVGEVNLSIPLICENKTSHIYYGNFYNTTDRIVGLKSQDTTFVLNYKNNNYNLKPFENECMRYYVKEDYLRPGDFVKGYFVLTGDVDQTENAPINSIDQELTVMLKTNPETDIKVAERVNLLSNFDIIKEANVVPDFSNSYVISDDQDINNSIVEKIVLGCLLFLSFCPIAIISVHFVYKSKKEKKT